MCFGPFKKPKIDKTPKPPPPPPEIDDQQILDAEDKKRRRAAAAFGNRDTILTGPAGAGAPQTQQKTAYGQ